MHSNTVTELVSLFIHALINNNNHQHQHLFIARLPERLEALELAINSKTKQNL